MPFRRAIAEIHRRCPRKAATPLASYLRQIPGSRPSLNRMYVFSAPRRDPTQITAANVFDRSRPDFALWGGVPIGADWNPTLQADKRRQINACVSDPLWGCPTSLLIWALSLPVARKIAFDSCPYSHMQFMKYPQTRLSRLSRSAPPCLPSSAGVMEAPEVAYDYSRYPLISRNAATG